MSFQWDANLYQQKHAFVAQYGSSLIELLQPQVQEKILDLGCGTGELTAQISEYGAEVTGIDRSADMIHQAKKQHPSINFSVMDAADLSTLPQYNAIFSNAALHWMLEPQTVAQQMYEHLKPGGRLIAELGGKGNINQLISGINHQRMQYGYAPINIEEQWYFPSIGEYTTLLEKTGFQVQLAHYYTRDTLLQDASRAIVDWFLMFGKTWLNDIPERKHEEFLGSVQEALRPFLFHNEAWYADYKRLRIMAVKE